MSLGLVVVCKLVALFYDFRAAAIFSTVGIV